MPGAIVGMYAIWFLDTTTHGNSADYLLLYVATAVVNFAFYTILCYAIATPFYRHQRGEPK